MTKGTPTPTQFQPYLVTEMEQAVRELQTAAPTLSVTLNEQIAFVVTDVLDTLKERGEQYGEDVIFMTGESGVLILVVWKALRMLWSMHAGLPYHDRKDGYRDLAGYAIIARAMKLYEGDTRCSHGFSTACPENCN